MKGRFFFIFGFFIIVYILLSSKLYILQVHQNNIFTSINASQKSISFNVAERGQIFFTDRNNSDVSIALTKDYPSIFLSPRDIENIDLVSDAIAPIAGLNSEDLKKNIEKKKLEKSEYFLLVPRATEEQVVQVENLKFKGVSIEERQARFYPFKNLGSQVIGFVEKEGNLRIPRGLYGIEKFYDSPLSNGNDIYLTIDRAIQDHAEGLLEKLVENYGADGGSIVVQNPKTGEILAMTSKPDFDPNQYNNYEIKNFLNPVVQLLYEPGSVIKPLTLSAGIDSGKVTPETTYVDTGSLTLNGKTIHNFQNKVYGKITMKEVIQNSVNTGAIYAERLVGDKIFYNYLSRFGFTEKTGIELPGEINSNLRNLLRKDVRAIDFATAAYGQGIAVTPISLISGYSALANEGVLMSPFITKGNEPKIVRRVIKKETAKTITDILVSTVIKNNVAIIPNYSVAGKTGTAFIADPKTGKYTEQMIHTFVGYAPAYDPRFTILVKLEKPAHGEAAGVTVVPTFKKLAEFLLNYYHVPPDLNSN